MVNKVIKSTTLKRILTFGLVILGWQIFRETNLDYLYQHLTAAPWKSSLADWRDAAYILIFLLIYSIPLIAHTLLHSFKSLKSRLYTPVVQHFIAGLLIILIVYFGSGRGGEFLYFQF